MKPGLGTLTHDEVNNMAAALDVRPQDVIEMETRLAGGDIALEPRPDESEEEFAPIAYLADSNSEPTEVLARRNRDMLQSDGIRRALDRLDNRSRRIVEARWLDEDPDGNVGTATLHDLAKEFGVSAERIRQIEAKALEKMRLALADAA
jgi:RNA polymerase sigma-32 factor